MEEEKVVSVDAPKPHIKDDESDVKRTVLTGESKPKKSETDQTNKQEKP